MADTVSSSMPHTVNVPGGQIGAIGGHIDVKGGINTYIHINNTPFSKPLNYRADINHIVTAYAPVFIGRNEAWRHLVAFAQQQAPGYLLVTAPAGYGKSALMVHIVLCHERGTWAPRPMPTLLYFFIRQEGQRHTAESFLQALNSQLLSTLRLKEDIPHSLDALRSQFTQLWSQAVRTAHARKPLLLIVDGLDEMAPSPVTIANLFPTTLTEYVHVIVSSRPEPDPRRQVSREHPFRNSDVLSLQSFSEAEVSDLLRAQGASSDTAIQLARRVHKLTRGTPLFARYVGEDVVKQGELALAQIERGGQSPQGVRDYFQDQYNAMKPAAQGLAKQVFGILLAALGGMSTEEMADLLKQDKQDLDDALEPVQRFLIGQPRMEFMHLELRQAVEQLFSRHERQGYQEQLLAWCRSYEPHHWPEETPAYVLSYYPGHLHAAGDSQALYGLIDQPWMERQFARTRTHRRFAEDVQLTIEQAAAETPLNWRQLIRGCLIYSTLSSMATDIPLRLLNVLVQLGEPGKARGDADLIQDDESRSLAFLVIGEALITGKQLPEAVAALEQALLAASELDDQPRQVQLLSWAAEDFSKAGQVVRAAEVARHAFAVAERLEGTWQNTKVFNAVVQALARTGVFEHVVTAVNMFASDWDKEAALGQIAPIFAEAGRLEQLWAAIKSIEDHAKSQMLRRIGQALAQAGMYAQALEAVRAHDAAFYRAKIMRAVTEALAQAGDFDTALKALSAFDDEVEPQVVSPVRRILGVVIPKLWGRKHSTAAERHSVWAEADKSDALKTLMHSLSVTRQKNNVVRIAQEACTIAMTLVPLDRVEILPGLARILARAGHIELATTMAQQALANTEEIQVEASRAEALSRVADAFVATGQKSQGCETAHQALALLRQTPDGRPNLVRYNAANILAQLGKFAQALEVVQEMTDKGYQALTWCRIAHALVQAQQQERATELANQALAMARDIPEAQDQADALRLMADMGLAKAGMFDLALEAVRAIADAKERGKALQELASTLAWEGALAPAIAAAKGIDDYSGREKALRDIALIFAHTGQSELAFKAVQAQESPWHKTTVLLDVTTRLRGSVQQEDAPTIIEQALSSARAIDTPAAAVQALSGLAKICLQEEQPQLARTIVEEVLAMIERVEPLKEPQRIQLLRAMARALAQRGALEQARTVANAIADETERYPVLAEMVRCYAEAGDHQQATAVAERVVVITKGLEKTSANLDMLLKAAASLAHVRTLEYALVVAEAIPDAIRQLNAHADIAKSLAQAGNHEQARALAQQTRQAIDRLAQTPPAHVMLSIADALAQAGTMEHALAVAEAITDSGGQARALSRLAQRSAEVGNEVQATRLAEQAIAVISLQDAGEKAEILAEVAQNLVEVGGGNRALALARQALGLLPSIQNDFGRMHIVSTIAEILARTGTEDEVASLVQQIATGDLVSDDTFKKWTWREVAKAFARAGKPELSVCTVRHITDESERKTSLSYVAHALAQAGQVAAQSGNLEATVALVQHALAVIDDVEDKDKALIHSEAAQALAMAGRSQEACTLLHTALKIAYPHGREAVLHVLTAGVLALAAVDEGKSLWQGYQALVEIDRWWNQGK
jgi:tetratricopeptide (TPR) repeat protein